MQDRPTDGELIEAVAQFLSDEVGPAIADPRLRFRLLIAANVLKIVKRELAMGDGPLLAEWQGLVTLLGQPEPAPPSSSAQLRAAIETLNRQLCARIRAGEANNGPWRDAVFAHVQATIVDKLRIANPRYLSDQ